MHIPKWRYSLYLIYQEFASSNVGQYPGYYILTWINHTTIVFWLLLPVINAFLDWSQAILKFLIACINQIPILCYIVFDQNPFIRQLGSIEIKQCTCLASISKYWSKSINSKLNGMVQKFVELKYKKEYPSRLYKQTLI